jgi:F0F1-type ATP synthase assembly protein I
MSEKRKYQGARIGAVLVMSAMIGIGLGAITTELFAESNPNELIPSLDLSTIVMALLGVASMIVLIGYLMEKGVESHG